MNITTKFNPMQHVMIDGDENIKAAILAVLIRNNAVQYEVAWMHCGASHSAWIEEWHLSPHNN